MQDEFLRKAAVLIATLDDQTAESLLEQIGRDQALLLRRVLGELAPVTVDERSHIIQEFIQAGTHEPAKAGDADGVEVDDSLAAKIAAAEPPAPDDELPDDSPDRGPSEIPEDSRFSFLVDASPDVLCELLSRELPQTISVVLSFLPPARAAEVLRRLPADRQNDVLQRLGQLQEADASIVDEIEQELRNQFQHNLETHRHSPLGPTAVRAILDASSGAERHRLIEQLQQSAPEVMQQIGWETTCHSPGRGLAETPLATRTTGATSVALRPSAPVAPVVRETESTSPHTSREAQLVNHIGSGQGPQRVFEFDDLTALDDNALAFVFRRADPEVALVALTGASPRLLDRIQRQLPWREARELKFQIARLGPIRLSDVERAQQRLAEVAGTLIREGVVTPPKNRRFIIAA
ncbi:MAG: hypothetical protein JJ992_04040 [Planctomycetes bacterium]|nr:hypothetical protein [Planctomycetota bacterium]